MMTDPLHVVHARAAGLDVHKMQITASVALVRAAAPASRRSRRAPSRRWRAALTRWSPGCASDASTPR